MDGDGSAEGWEDGRFGALDVVESLRPMRRRPQLRRRIVRMPRVSCREMVCIGFASSSAAGKGSVAFAFSLSLLSSAAFPSPSWLASLTWGRAAGIAFLFSQYNSHIPIASVALLRSIEDFKGEALARSCPVGEMSMRVVRGACKEWLSKRVSDSVINCICIMWI